MKWAGPGRQASKRWGRRQAESRIRRERIELGWRQMGRGGQGGDRGTGMGEAMQGQMDESRWNSIGPGWGASHPPNSFPKPPSPLQVLVPPLLVPAQGSVRHVPQQPALGA